MNAKEQPRMFRELVLIRSRLFALGCKLIRQEDRPSWVIEQPKERNLWLEFERGSWTLRPLGSEHKYPEIWKTIMEAIFDANK